MTYNSRPWTCGAYDYGEYYDSHRQLYAQCPRVGNDSFGFMAARDCTAIDIPSEIRLQCAPEVGKIQLAPPLLNLSIFTFYRGDEAGDTPKSDKCFNRFSCAAQLIERESLDGRQPGSCKASRSYAWGFSFHFVFLTSSLSSAVAGTLYVLWIHARRLAPGRVEGSAFLDAALMVQRAQRQFAGDVHEWPKKRVEEVVLNGPVGMGEADAELRLRRLGRG